MINMILEIVWNSGFSFEWFPCSILGALIKLSNNCRTAERRRPYDEFNHGVAITHRPLKVSFNQISRNVFIFIKNVGSMSIKTICISTFILGWWAIWAAYWQTSRQVVWVNWGWNDNSWPIDNRCPPRHNDQSEIRDNDDVWLWYSNKWQRHSKVPIY